MPEAKTTTVNPPAATPGNSVIASATAAPGKKTAPGLSFRRFFTKPASPPTTNSRGISASPRSPTLKAT